MVEKQIADKLEHIKGPGCTYRLVIDNQEQKREINIYDCGPVLEKMF
ncbi:hypothetical protein X474_06680 [Dethiosulfatarculus sandiegensis]|uniref:Uncharacterized protein n=1 Tax=Dethiosulfatarculus sandiegensis TaxID=1429043 RepID=A0A0D2JZ45_9BACT|nr:hypothetical protein X474_06680 [Dethiosulfatarculus sandiegensis]